MDEDLDNLISDRICCASLGILLRLSCAFMWWNCFGTGITSCDWLYNETF